MEPSPSSKWKPSRLTVARKRRGLSKIALADRVGGDRRSIVAYEAGEYPPSPETRRQLESTLGFPAGFFAGDDLDELVPDAVSFRSMSKMTAAQRDMAIGGGTIALHLLRWIDQRYGLPPAALPDLGRERPPEAAATALRAAWGLGEQPIPNLVHLLESKGVRIFSLAIDSREVDAFSTWKDETPLIFLNTLKSAERGRFDAAHELGHLVLHRHASPEGRTAEREADEFASAFLMPRAAVIAHAPKFATLPVLVKLKHRWIVSISALARRLRDLEAISEWHYRNLAVEISRRGYRTDEPEPARRETSLLLEKVFGALRSEGVRKADVARELGIADVELDELVFGLIMTSLPGGKSGQETSISRGDGKLRLLP